jgi:hypothetical protein
VPVFRHRSVGFGLFCVRHGPERFLHLRGRKDVSHQRDEARDDIWAFFSRGEGISAVGGGTMAKATTKPAVATAADRAPRKAVRPAALTESDIARRAYDLYVARGREDGHDMEDWLQAEQELRADPER